MGCVNSKKARPHSPAFHDFSSACASAPSGLLSVHEPTGPLEKIKEEPEKEADERPGYDDKSREVRKEASRKNAVYSIKVERLPEGELVAAGWPPWLAAVAGDAIEGWLPLRSDSYERLEKIGQGTYSNVYRARDLKTGKMVAVKKVHFDNFQPESVRFMAREILILRKLNHPNVMKLEGIITNRMSCIIYLVFEYMEHDLAGLLSCPDVKFTDSQIKCLMRQLLSGLEHCHSRGIMHRDIKCSNILVNNDGVLKIADFGLAYFTRPRNKQPLTSRVVTLWYRPPELLLGSTSYGETVDLWSVGCVFSELFIGRPILKGRNEVEQLHKIFKLCGSPSEDYWKASKLPLASIFKPQLPYESTLEERCKEFPKCALRLVQTLLSVEPHKRGTAASALTSEYFNTKPYACDPSSLPKYPPNKEIDAKAREEERSFWTPIFRKSSSIRPVAASKNPRKTRRTLLQESSDFCKVIPTEDDEAKVHLSRVTQGDAKRRSAMGSHPSLNPPSDTRSEVSQASYTTQDSLTSVRSVPMQMTASSGFAWAKKQKQQDLFTRLYNQPTLRSHKSFALESSNTHTPDSDSRENEDPSGRGEVAKLALRRKQARIDRHESFDASSIYEPQDSLEDYGKNKGREVLSGPLMHQPQEITLSRYDQTQVLRRSRFHKE